MAEQNQDEMRFASLLGGGFGREDECFLLLGVDIFEVDCNNSAWLDVIYCGGFVCWNEWFILTLYHQRKDEDNLSQQRTRRLCLSCSSSLYHPPRVSNDRIHPSQKVNLEPFGAVGDHPRLQGSCNQIHHQLMDSAEDGISSNSCQSSNHWRRCWRGSVPMQYLERSWTPCSEQAGSGHNILSLSHSNSSIASHTTLVEAVNNCVLLVAPPFGGFWRDHPRTPSTIYTQFAHCMIAYNDPCSDQCILCKLDPIWRETKRYIRTESWSVSFSSSCSSWMWK